MKPNWKERRKGKTNILSIDTEHRTQGSIRTDNLEGTVGWMVLRPASWAVSAVAYNDVDEDSQIVRFFSPFTYSRRDSSCIEPHNAASPLKGLIG